MYESSRAITWQSTQSGLSSFIDGASFLQKFRLRAETFAVIISTNMTRKKRIQIILFLWFGTALVVGMAVGLERWNEQKTDSFDRTCRHAFDQRDWELLRTTAEEWRVWNPDSVDALVFLADAAQQTGNFSAAAEYLLMVPENTPKTIPAFVAAMKIQFGPLNHPLEGEETAKMILKIEPRTVEAHTGLIEFYVVSSQHAKLIEQIRKAIELKCETPAAYVYLFLADTYRVGNATELNETWLLNHPDSEVFLVARAIHLPEPGPGVKGEDKYEIVEELLGRFPHNNELLAYKIDVSIRLGKYDEVVQLLKKVEGGVENDSRFWRFKGWAHLTKNQYAESEEALNKALELRPMDWDARNWLSDLIRQKGDLDSARQHEEIVLQARRLRETITQLGSVDDLPREILSNLQTYAEDCGDELVAAGLQRRISSRTRQTGSRNF